MLRAKGRWASREQVRAADPLDGRQAGAENARHPLLQQTLRAAGREIVPLDLQLDRRKRILVISGPNAGGSRSASKPRASCSTCSSAGFRFRSPRSRNCRSSRAFSSTSATSSRSTTTLSTYSSHLLEHEALAGGRLSRTLVLIDEVRVGNRAGHRKISPRRSSSVARQGVLWRDPLRQYRAFTPRRWRARQRRDSTCRTSGRCSGWKW